MPNVAFQREEVRDLKPRWDLVRDCIAGQAQIKAKGEAYLPKPNAADTSDENATRYKQYKERAVFYNVTGRTLEGLIGQVFAKDPVATLPTLLELLLEDVDGGGVSLEQQSKKALGHVLAFGRAFLLADYPRTEAPATAADLAAGNIRPTLALFDPWDVVNWRVATIGARKLLTLVVISEADVVDDDGFEAKKEEYYRVLRLDTEGIYRVEIWYWDEGLNDYVLEEQLTPLNSAGQPWREIPGMFLGAKNNDPTPDLPPLYDLATLNIAHYRNSADYEESAYIVGQPTPYFAGLTEQWVKEVLKGTVQLGSRGAIPLPEGGSAGLLQASPNSMPKEAMEHKEKQMVALGAKLVEQKTVQRTATEAGIEETSETSVLATAAKNVSAAYTATLKWAGEFVGAADSEIAYELSTEFEISRMSAQDVAQMIASWQANAITFEEMRDNLRRGGIAYLDDEEAKAQMDASGLDLGVPVGSPASAAAQAAKAKEQAQAEAARQQANQPPAV